MESELFCEANFVEKAVENNCGQKCGGIKKVERQQMGSLMGMAEGNVEMRNDSGQ